MVAQNMLLTCEEISPCLKIIEAAIDVHKYLKKSDFSIH